MEPLQYSNAANEQEQKLWVVLAELFFLDTEPQDEDYIRTAQLLKEAGWNREKTREVLIELVAPSAGSNVGFLIYPVIGEWAGFDKVKLCSQIVSISKSRSKNPKWFFWVSDWFCERMLKKLDMELLLKRMPEL